MSNISVGLVIITIICFILGAWPISIAALGALIYVTKVQQPKESVNKRTVEEIERENEALRAELANQAVRHAIEKTELRKSKEEEK